MTVRASAGRAQLGLKRIFANGTSVELWSSMQDETAARLAEARRFTIGVVIMVVVFGCILSIMRQSKAPQESHGVTSRITRTQLQLDSIHDSTS